MAGALARAAVAALVAAAVAAPAGARADGRPWYAPDHAKLQLAGNIGFLSPGLGYAWGRRLEGDLFFGWVPEAIGGADIFSLTGKLLFAPWTLGSGRWSLRPITAALQVTYTFGDQYFVVPEFEFTPTALRGGIALGAEARRRVGTRTVGLYGELVALDLGLVHWLSNRDALGPAEVFSAAFGVRVGF
jgi:hypothetical protein